MLMPRTRLLAGLLLSLALCAHAEEKQDKPNRVERVAKKTADGVERTVKRTGKWAERTGNRAGKAVERTVDKTESWVKKKTE